MPALNIMRTRDSGTSNGVQLRRPPCNDWASTKYLPFCRREFATASCYVTKLKRAGNGGSDGLIFLFLIRLICGPEAVRPVTSSVICHVGPEVAMERRPRGGQPSSAIGYRRGSEVFFSFALCFSLQLEPFSDRQRLLAQGQDNCGSSAAAPLCCNRRRTNGHPRSCHGGFYIRRYCC